MNITEQEASNLALIKILQNGNLSKEDLEATLISCLLHFYKDDINKVLLFIDELSSVKNRNK